MEDVVTQAEKVIQDLKDHLPKTSQLRKILSAVSALDNKITAYVVNHPEVQTLPKDMVNEIQSLRVRVAYQAGRIPEVKRFVEQAQLNECLRKIGDNVEAFKEFARYMEALVAYHKFYGGED